MDQNTPVFSQDDLATILAINRYMHETGNFNKSIDCCTGSALMALLLLGDDSHIRYLIKEYNSLILDIADQEMAIADYEFIKAGILIINRINDLAQWMRKNTPKGLAQALELSEKPTKLSLALYGTWGLEVLP